MASRAKAKEQARERARQLREEQERSHRRAVRLAWLSGAIVALGIIAWISFAILGGGSTNNLSNSGSALQLSDLQGLQSTPAPWQPEYGSLPERLATLQSFGLPSNGDESYHVHAHLAIYVNGSPVTVPANVAISAADQIEAPMHTHDTSGVIHIEASQPSNAFTLGAFFDLWGVTFSANQLGSYQDSSGSTVQVYVNGHRIADPAHYALRPHDDIVVGYGTPGSFPHIVAFTWPTGE